MGSCYSGEHMAEHNVHSDTKCNIEEPLQKYRSVIDYLGLEGRETCLNGSKGVGKKSLRN